MSSADDLGKPEMPARSSVESDSRSDSSWRQDPLGRRSEPDMAAVADVESNDGRIGRDRHLRTRSSALWAAYGDALGFVSELVDERGLRRRTNGQSLDRLRPWVRRIGGRMGVTVELPAGCYSDDTQLRLATGRAVSGKGFDVEAFAKIELPVWPSYSLGGGRASKAAAGNLAKSNVTWFSNTYDGWLDAGGNGVAMRIQPHVWSASNLDDPATYLVDVLKNGVCTHGNPRALFGAVLHAICLARTVSTGTLPSIEGIDQILADSVLAEGLVRADAELSELWLTTWERSAKEEFHTAWQRVAQEARAAFDLVVRNLESAPDDSGTTYSHILREVGLYENGLRGSGILTVIASLALGWITSEPHEAMRIAANAIGSDTDTIATMTGALVGATTSIVPNEPVLDDGLIISEADRLYEVALGSTQSGHRYPDLLKWLPPRTQADALGESAHGLTVAGLGMVREMLAAPIPSPRGDAAWQWVRLASRQTLLIKRRNTLPRSQEVDLLLKISSERPADDASANESNLGPRVQMSDVSSAQDRARVGSSDEHELDLDLILGWLDDKSYSDAALGYAVRRVASQGSHDQLIALVAVIRERIQRLL